MFIPVLYFMTLIACLLWELKIHMRTEIVDVGFHMTTSLYNLATKLNENQIKRLNQFCGIIPFLCFVVLTLYGMYIDGKILKLTMVGFALRCVMGTLTQAPCPNENKQFFPGEFGGFGKHRAMIWMFSGHCFQVQMAIFVFQSRLLIGFQVLQILWFLSTRAHYSNDIFVGCTMPYIIHHFLS